MLNQNERLTRIVAWALLSLGFAVVLYGIVALCPHPYAGRGLAIFLAVAVPAAMFLREWRWRWRAIGLLAAVMLVGVVALHALGTNTITIANRSAKEIESLYVTASGEAGWFALAGLRPGQTVTVRFQDLRFEGRIRVEGEFEDGTRFPDILRQPFGGMLAGSAGPTRDVHVLIDAAGMVQVTPARD